MWLIDTPGFNDTKTPSIDVLVDVTGELTRSYRARERFSGVIYLHDIRKPRVDGALRQNLEMMKAMVGDDEETLGRIVLVTTWWDSILEKDKPKYEKLEEEFLEDHDFWQPMSVGQSVKRRLLKDVGTEERQSEIEEILSVLFDRETVVLNIQHELVNLNKDLRDTQAGEVLDKENQELRMDTERKYKEAEQRMKDAEAAGKRDMMRIQAAQKERLRQRQIEFDRREAMLTQKFEALLSQRDGRLADLENRILTEQQEVREAVAETARTQSAVSTLQEQLDRAQLERDDARSQNSSLLQREAQRPEELFIAAQLRMQQTKLDALVEQISKNNVAQQMCQQGTLASPQAQNATLSTTGMLMPMALAVAMSAFLGIPAGLGS